MNRLLSFTGQMPIYLGDFDFIQDASKSMLTCLARALMNVESNELNAILQGGEILYSVGGNDIVWGTGVVVINGELLPLKSGAASGTSATPLYFHVVEENSGERVFKDGTTHSCWATRYAIINTTAADGILVSSVPRLHDQAQSDFQVYVGSPTGQITSAKLIKMNGFWFVDVVLNIAEGVYSNLGTVTFSNVNPEHIEALATKTFPFIIAINTAIYNSDIGEWGNYTYVAQPIQVTFSAETAPGSRSFLMGVEAYNMSVRFKGTAKLLNNLLVY